MNAAVILALVTAVSAILLFKRVLTHLFIRRAGRQALQEVGKRALTKLPVFVSLARVENPDWTNEELVRQQAEPLLRCGFEDAGVYSVDKMPGVLIRMMCQPQTGVAAHVHDHPRQGSWIEMVTRYEDGSTHAVVTLPPTGLKTAEWFRKIYADKAVPTDQIYKRYLTQRRQDNVKHVPTSEIVREFEDVYHRLALWRHEAGISPQEVARVAVKWAEKKKVNVAGV